jgi:hypothetical protein
MGASLGIVTARSINPVTLTGTPMSLPQFNGRAVSRPEAGRYSRGTPGTYTVKVSVTATVTATGKKYPIQESLQVVVK